MNTDSILHDLSSADNERRRVAEARWTTTSVENRVTLLLQQLSIQDLAPVLLRREIWNLKSPEQLQHVLQALLQKQNTPHPYCLAEIAAVLESSNESTLACQAVTTMLSHYPQEVPVWVAVAERAPKAYADSGAWQQLPTDNNSLALLVWTANALTQSQHALLQSKLVQTLQLQHSEDDDDLVWEWLVQASEQVPTLLKGDALTTILQACRNSSSLLAVQVVVFLLQHDKAAVDKNVVEHALATCWNVLVETTTELDPVEWASVPLQDDGVEDEDDFAQALLTEFIHLVGSPALAILLLVVERAFSELQPRAALVALECAAVALPLQFQQHVLVALETGISYTTATDPLTQYHALRLLGVLCETSKTGHEIKMLKPIASAINNSHPKIAAMACQVVTAFYGNTEDSTKPSILQYIPDILQALLTGPLRTKIAATSDEMVVQVRAVGAVARLAQSAGVSFTPFYTTIMPRLFEIVTSNVTSFMARHLAGASLEAITIIGQALGSEQAHIFVPDAHVIMQRLAIPQLRTVAMTAKTTTPATITDVVIPMDQLLTACARIASVLGEAYSPYISVVLSHLLLRAADPTDVEFSEADITSLDEAKHSMSNNNGEMYESTTVAIPGRGLLKVTINTSKIQEKAQASRAVYEHAVALGKEFGPFCEPCLEAFVPLLEFKYSGEIRGTAAETVAVVLEAACIYEDSSGNMQIVSKYLPQVAIIIAKQISDSDMTDAEVVYALTNALSGICRLVFVYDLRDIFSQNVTRLIQSCMQSIVDCLQRRSTISQDLANLSLNDDERQCILTLLNGEEELLRPLVDSVGYILKSYRDAFLPIFESQVVPILGPYLKEGGDIRARLSAVCLFDDCVEHCGSAAAAHFGPLLVEGIKNGIDDALNGYDAELMRASIYGIAQIARYAPPTILQAHAQNFVQQLLMITSSNSECLQTFENAISALASLVLFVDAPFRTSGFVKHTSIIQTFLSALPLREDTDEAKICHAGLCAMIEEGSIDANSEREQLERIMSVTLQLVNSGEEIASRDTCEKFDTMLNQLQCFNATSSNCKQVQGFANVASY